MILPSRLGEMALREFTACGIILLCIDHIVTGRKKIEMTAGYKRYYYTYDVLGLSNKFVRY